MATSGKPSTWFPLGKLEGQEPLPLSFSRNFEICKKNLVIFELLQKSGVFKVIFTLQYHFYKFKTILGFTITFSGANIFKNYFCMVQFIVVRWSILARLATVLVWEREVNCQPGFRSGTRRAGDMGPLSPEKEANTRLIGTWRGSGRVSFLPTPRSGP